MSRLNTLIVFLILFFLSLNEFYHESFGRVLDYLSLIFIILFFLIDKSNRRFVKSDLSFFVFFSPFIIVGLLNFKILPSLAVFFGVTLISFFTKNIMRSKVNLGLILDFVLLLHLIAFIIQIFAFYVLNKPFSYIDFFPFFQQSRVYNEGLNLLRPGGFMMEPNSYSANVFMLVFLNYKISNRLSNFSKVALISVPFTTSLWGIGMISLLGFLNLTTKYKILVIGLFAALLPIILDFLGNSIAFERVLRIIEDPTSDNSIVTRLGLETNSSVNFLNLFFGNGINSTDFQAFLGGNGISYVVYCFGILGSILLLCWIIVSNNIKITILVLFFHLTFPYYSYLIYWVFLTVILKGIDFSVNKDHLLNENNSLL
jgi:hypothetical protein